MKRKFLFAILFLIIAVFIFQACDLPTENKDNGEICESYHYDVEITYERLKKPIFDYPGFEVGIFVSWKPPSVIDMEKVSENKYKILLKDVPVNRPKHLSHYKQDNGDMAIMIYDIRLWLGQEIDPNQDKCMVPENVYARVPGKTGKVKLTRSQPARLIGNPSEATEILIDLYCDGRIN